MRLRLLCAAGALAVSLGAPAWAAGVVVATAPGAWADALRQVVFDPFTKAAGIAVRTDSYSGGIGILRTRIENGTNPWDLVEVPGDTLQLGCAEALFAPIDIKRLGGAARFRPEAVSRCGVGFVLAALVLSWDRDKFQGTPSWADFWDVAKYPGKRGLRRGVRTNLEIALMADGVAPGDVYSVLRTSDGVERAFRKLDQLKPYIVWWRTPAQAARILGSGEVLMTSALNGAVAAANRTGGRNFGIQWTGSLDEVLNWALIAGRTDTDAAYRLITYAVDPAREAALSALVPYVGLSKGAEDPVAAADDPATPAHRNAGVMIDDAFWRDNLDRLSQRFEAWLAH